jgi:hypothetical protein
MDTWKSVAIAAVVLAACNETTGPPEGGLGPAVVAYEDEMQVELPASIAVGDTLVVRVTSWEGHGLAARKGETRITVEGRTVTVAPFDEWGDGPRLSIVSPIEHRAEVTFATPGSVTVVVAGLSWPTYQRIERRFTVEVR